MGTLTRTAQELSLRERLRLKRNAKSLLLDISYSMACDLEPGYTKIQALRDVVDKITTPVQLYAFNDKVVECTKDTIPPCNGGTCLSPAFKLIKSKGATKCVVITDGEINSHDQDASLQEAIGLIVEVLYIGPEPKPAFLEKLANASGGFCSQHDLHMPAELEAKLQRLLGPAPTDDTGVIEL